MIVISDTSVLVNLAWLNQLDVLHTLYGKVLIPEGVWTEIVVKGAGKPGAAEAESATWIEVKSPQNRDLVRSFQQTLDLGEAEAIALAIEQGADLLLMDERLGRSTAIAFDLNVIGLLGVLIEARQKDLILTLKPLLDKLRYQIGFYISEQLYQHVLSIVDE